MKLLPGSSLDLRYRQLSVVDSPAALRRLGFAVAVGASGSVGMWSMPVALPFVQADFGIARADASLPYTLAMMGFALGGVAMGRLCDRFGVMVALMSGSLALGIGYAGAALVPGALTFALMHLFIGVGASATFGPLMADMSQWFARYRGIAVGMAASGNYIGGALWPPLLHMRWRPKAGAIPISESVFCVLATLPSPPLPADPRSGPSQHGSRCRSRAKERTLQLTRSRGLTACSLMGIWCFGSGGLFRTFFSSRPWRTGQCSVFNRPNPLNQAVHKFERASIS